MVHFVDTVIFNVSVNYENVEKLASMIYAPYKVYVAKYEKYEDETLTEELNSIRLVRNIPESTVATSLNTCFLVFNALFY